MFLSGYSFISMKGAQKMRCSKAQKRLYAYLDNELKKSDSSCVNSHLQNCHRCQQRAMELSRLNQLISRQLEQPVPVGFSWKVIDKILQERATERTILLPQKGWIPKWIRILPLAPTLACFLAALTAGYLVTSFSASSMKEGNHGRNGGYFMPIAELWDFSEGSVESVEGEYFAIFSESSIGEEEV